MTGLDYLRARYYDSQVGTFLTEDSYSGELTDPLSQNLYTYVQNNPVNYTDPSGHRKMSLNVPSRRIINTRNQRKYSQVRVDPALSSHSGIGGGGYYSAANHIRHRVQSNPSYRPPASYYAAFAQFRPMLEVIMAEAAPATIRLTSSNKPRLEPSPNANKTSAMPMPKQLVSREHRGPKRLKTSTSTGAPPSPQPSDMYVIRRLPRLRTNQPSNQRSVIPSKKM